MIYISKGLEKVAVATVEDGKALQSALNDNDCIYAVVRQNIIGKDLEAGFEVCFDTYEIKAIEQRDAETILHWLLSLGVPDVLIRRCEP